jgi:hypothetical protein
MATSIDAVRKAGRIDEIANDFSLDQIETNLLEFMCCYSSMQPVEALWDRVLGGRGSRALVSDVRRLAGIAGADPGVGWTAAGAVSAASPPWPFPHESRRAPRRCPSSVARCS